MGGGWSSKDVPSQQGKTFLITGANTGIGFEAARVLGRAGATVIIACRDERRGQAALDDLRNAAPEGTFEMVRLDISDLSSVRACATTLVSSGRAIDVLINNAGIMYLQERRASAEGIEMQMATNHLGHFALTGLLLPALQRAPAPRVVNVSSMLAAGGGGLRCMATLRTPADVVYSPERAYDDSKLANLLFTKELAKRYPGVISVAVHPGVSSTGLFQHSCYMRCFQCCCCCWFQSASGGALPSLRAAVAPDVSSGSYIGPEHTYRGAPIVIPMPFSASQDPAIDSDFWNASADVSGVRW